MIRLSLALFILVFSSLAPAEGVFDSLFDRARFEHPDHDSLTLFFYTAPKPIQWNTPGAMVRSAIWNTLSGDSSPLSHLDVLVSCVGETPILSGMARTKTWDTVWSVLSGRQSLEMLTESYPGHLIAEENILAEMPESLRSGRVRALSFQISAATCQRTSKYLKEYQARGFTKTYAGFKANPFRGEGAGCAAYGMSVLKVAGLLREAFVREWTRHVNIPRRLMNFSGHSAVAGFWSFMLLGVDEHWASREEPAETITIFDPELMYHWVERQTQKLALQIDERANPPTTADYWKFSWPP